MTTDVNKRNPKRRTFGISIAANENLKAVCRALRINQYDLVSLLLEDMNIEDPHLRRMVQKRKLMITRGDLIEGLRGLSEKELNDLLKQANND